MRPINLMNEVGAVVEAMGWKFSFYRNGDFFEGFRLSCGKDKHAVLTYMREANTIDVIIRTDGRTRAQQVFPYSDTALTQVKQFIEENS